MDDSARQTEQRKREHLTPFKSGGVNAREQTTWLKHVHLIHRACPELHVDELDLSNSFAGHTFKAPLFITGMTGGTSEAREINRALARTAERLGIGFGLGSQRAMLENPELTHTYQVRDVAPTVFLAGNLGGTQLAQTNPDTVRGLLDAVEADALCVHLNPAQEMMQPEGDRDFRGILTALERLTATMKRPLIVKETGAGLSRETVLQLLDVGVHHVDVSGTGGTSWVGVEVNRRGGEADPDLLDFWDWGIPTAAALLDLKDLDLQRIGAGGIRTGLDVARAIALGADLAGAASPAIQAYFNGGEEACYTALSRVLDGLKRAMLLTASRSLSDLKRAPRVIQGALLEWQKQRQLQG